MRSTLDCHCVLKNYLLVVSLHHENSTLQNYRTLNADSIRAHIRKILSLEDRNYGPQVSRNLWTHSTYPEVLVHSKGVRIEQMST